MTEITTVGVDLAKSVFQIHGVDAEGSVVLRRQLRRNQMLEFFQRLGLCCTNPVRDSSRESSMVAVRHEQTDTSDLQDQELAGLQ